MGPFLAFYFPTDPQQSGEDTPCFSGWPVAHLK